MPGWKDGTYPVGKGRQIWKFLNHPNPQKGVKRAVAVVEDAWAMPIHVPEDSLPTSRVLDWL